MRCFPRLGLAGATLLPTRPDTVLLAGRFTHAACTRHRCRQQRTTGDAIPNTGIIFLSKLLSHNVRFIVSRKGKAQALDFCVSHSPVLPTPGKASCLPFAVPWLRLAPLNWRTGTLLGEVSWDACAGRKLARNELRIGTLTMLVCIAGVVPRAAAPDAKAPVSAGVAGEHIRTFAAPSSEPASPYVLDGHAVLW